MIIEYIQDKQRAARLELTDPVLQKMIHMKHWQKMSDDEIFETLGLSKREFRVYMWAYERYESVICF